MVLLIQKDGRGNHINVAHFKSHYEALAALPMPWGRVDIVRSPGRSDWTLEQWLEWVLSE